MKLYFIRHAPTEANLSGSMVNGYDNANIILQKKPLDWEEKVGKFIPTDMRRKVFSSPALRCIQTCELLFGFKPSENQIRTDLQEFDCHKLGDKKFWEITEDEFNGLVQISSLEMKKRVRNILTNSFGNSILISHGMLIRYIYHYFNGNENVSAYDVINSKGFRFSNLDLLEVDTQTRVAIPHYYNKPIKH
jgi:broad specificity phosphatase PhoE